MDATDYKLHHACLLFRKRSPDVATTNWGGRHLIGACYSFIDPEGMKGWVGLVDWPIADGLPTCDYPSATGRAQDREVRRPKDRRHTTVPRNHCYLLSLLSTKFYTHCTVPRKAEGWVVDVGTSVKGVQAVHQRGCRYIDKLPRWWFSSGTCCHCDLPLCDLLMCSVFVTVWETFMRSDSFFWQNGSVPPRFFAHKCRRVIGVESFRRQCQLVHVLPG